MTDILVLFVVASLVILTGVVYRIRSRRPEEKRKNETGETKRMGWRGGPIE